MADLPKLPTTRKRKPVERRAPEREKHSVSFQAPFFRGEASGHGIYVLAVLALVVLAKYLL